MKNSDQLSPNEWQLLSAYLDAQLSEQDQRQAEQLLKDSPDCRAALEDLKRLQGLLRLLPMRRVPRNFTLSDQPAARTRLPSLILLLRTSSALTALLLTALLALDFIPAFHPLAGRLRLAEQTVAAPAAAQAEMALAADEEAPDIIFWGGMPAVGAFGMGAAPDPGYGIGGVPEAGLAAPEMAMPEALLLIPEEIPKEMPEDERLPLQETDEAPADLEIIPELAPELPPLQQEAAPRARQPLTGSGPILGVRPQQEQGRMEIPGQQTIALAPRVPVALRTLQWVLAAVLLVTAVPAWFLRRR